MSLFTHPASPAVAGTYVPSLVLLSVLVAVMSAYTALNLTIRVTHTKGRIRTLWRMAAALAMGGGIWSMHFIGMLAYSLPFQISYDLHNTLLSLLVAVVVSLAALGFVTRKSVNGLDILVGGLLMGSGICAMHYMGMYAMNMYPAIHYERAGVATSIAIAIAASVGALWLTLKLRTGQGARAHVKMIGAAIIMGFAVVAMHYVGMSAAHFYPSDICASDTGISSGWLAALVAIVTLMLLAMMLLLSAVDARLAVRHASLSLSEANRRLLHLALHDSLTGLPNRRLLEDRIDQAIRKSQRSGGGFALMFLDLDRFKTINDSLGHDVGDKLLQAVAGRLSGCLRSEDTVARLGGDEFVILLGEALPSCAAATVAEKVLEAVALPVETGGQVLTVSVSLGISIYPNDGTSVNELMRHADSAMYHAKKMGRDNVQFFTPELNLAASNRLAFERTFRNALENEEFELHYQPKVDVASGNICGMEALVRWRSPERGLVLPGEFIATAEETGLIVPLGAWVLREACRQNRAWQEAGLPRLRVAVNLSAHQFRQRNLPEVVARILKETGLEPSCLELEVTESVVMHNPGTAAQMLELLHAQGIHISVDDFGTGYSSLSYLKQFRLDNLKIDRSFVRDISRDADDAAIVASVVALAHTLRLRVIAEGVESNEQLDYLRELGCDEYQGYLCSRPLPAPAFEAMLRASTCGADAAPAVSGMC